MTEVPTTNPWPNGYALPATAGSTQLRPFLAFVADQLDEAACGVKASRERPLHDFQVNAAKLRQLITAAYRLDEGDVGVERRLAALPALEERTQACIDVAGLTEADRRARVSVPVGDLADLRTLARIAGQALADEAEQKQRAELAESERGLHAMAVVEQNKVIARLQAAIDWACGEGDAETPAFPGPHCTPTRRYGWRITLRELAGMRVRDVKTSKEST